MCFRIEIYHQSREVYVVDVMRVQGVRKKTVRSSQVHSDGDTGLTSTWRTEVSTAVLFPKKATNTGEAAYSVLRKCKWLFVSGCKSKNPICTVKEF